MRNRSIMVALIALIATAGSCRRAQPEKKSPSPTLPVPHKQAEPKGPAEAPAPQAKFLGKAAMLAQSGASISDVAERAIKSVVNISSNKVVRRKRASSPWESSPWRRWFQKPSPSPRYTESRGSGVIVSSDGVVLTNNHVVADGRDIKVVLNDGSTLAAILVGSDAKSEVAVLRLKLEPGRKVPAMPMGDSSRLRLAQVVLAIGNPFGMGQTVTMGIVSAVGRANMGIVDYEDFIQTDAAINPGNSGGALVDLAGRLVGINTAIYSRTGGYQGIGFAIPTRMAKPIMDSLLSHGRVVRGYLGVEIQDLDADTAKVLGIPGVRGVQVAKVKPNSPAARAGLQPGDIITALDGEKIKATTRLRTRVAAVKPGSRIVLDVLRRSPSSALDSKLRITATLTELGGPPVARLEGDKGVLAGLTVETLNEFHRRKLKLDAKAGGVLVTRVEWASPAAQAGLKEGDLIVEVNRQEVKTAARFSKLYSNARGKVMLLIYREGSPMYLLVEK